MKKTRVIILGGGISGLACAWEVAKDPSMEVTLLEKEKRVGGWIKSDRDSEFFFESGPRFFKTSRYGDLLRLIDELDLKSELIVSSQLAKSRYVWAKGELRLVPQNFSAFLLSSFTRPFLGALLSEWRKPVGSSEDESVWDFVMRRFSQEIAEYLFDPLMTGIFAGDIRKLSIASCFPVMKQWEREHGSVTRGFFKERFGKRKKASGSLPASSFFSLRGGVETLTKRLYEKLKDKIALEQEVKKIAFSDACVEVEAQNRVWRGDLLISALPAKTIGGLLNPVQGDIGNLLLNIPTSSFSIVQLGYKEELLPVQGIGYLVPSCENENLLGVMFDSSAFPQNNRFEKETRLSVMMRPSMQETDDRLVQKALSGLKKHLNLQSDPAFIRILHANEAIPQFEVGHKGRTQQLKVQIRENLPRLRLIGNYLDGVSVNDCVRTGFAQDK